MELVHRNATPETIVDVNEGKKFRFPSLEDKDRSHVEGTTGGINNSTNDQNEINDKLEHYIIETKQLRIYYEDHEKKIK